MATDTLEAKMAVTELAAGGSLGDDGRYRLRQILGTGGMASVWLAEDTRLRRPVAVKVLADSLALDEDYVARFEREALVAARLSHPNLVSVFDFGVGGPRPYLVMEYVPGGTLADRLRGRREDWEAEAVFRDLMGALAHVHAAGIIHRDIKPGNVLIGSDGRTRLTDFGVARPSDGEPLTSAGLVVGTARFVAPEILHGRRPDERSDLFASGVLLHDCLRASGPHRLRWLADRLTAERPEDRPSSATEVLELLDGRNTGTTAIRPGRSTFHARRRFRAVKLRPTRSAVAVGAIALVLVALLIVLVAGGSGGGRARPSPAVAAPAPNAGLNTQLDYLDRIVARARR
jgi:serine/threonine protein kinase